MIIIIDTNNSVNILKTFSVCSNHLMCIVQYRSIFQLKLILLENKIIFTTAVREFHPTKICCPLFQTKIFTLLSFMANP